MSCAYCVCVCVIWHLPVAQRVFLSKHNAIKASELKVKEVWDAEWGRLCEESEKTEGESLQGEKEEDMGKTRRDTERFLF